MTWLSFLLYKLFHKQIVLRHQYIKDKAYDQDGTNHPPRLFTWTIIIYPKTKHGGDVIVIEMEEETK